MLRRVVRRLVQTGTLLPAIYLLILLAFAYRSMYPALFRTWFLSSDEYVFAAEVIRFSNLDFHQHYFDMPGTPFMMLSTIIWRLVYACAGVLGIYPGSGIGEFTFQHISGLFILMRATTLACYLISPVLLFMLVSRLCGKGAAAVAALLLVMSPIYASYSSFIRVESLAMVLMLSALLAVNRGLARDKYDPLRADAASVSITEFLNDGRKPVN